MYDSGAQTVITIDATDVDSSFKELTGNNRYFVIPATNFISVNRLRLLELYPNGSIQLSLKDTRYNDVIKPTSISNGEYVAFTAKHAMNAKFSGMSFFGSSNISLADMNSGDILTPVIMAVIAGTSGVSLYNIKTEFVETSKVRTGITYPHFSLSSGSITPNVPTSTSLYVTYTMNRYQYTPAITRSMIASGTDIKVIVPTTANGTGGNSTYQYVTEALGDFIILNSTSGFKTV